MTINERINANDLNEIIDPWNVGNWKTLVQEKAIWRHYVLPLYGATEVKWHCFLLFIHATSC